MKRTPYKLILSLSVAFHGLLFFGLRPADKKIPIPELAAAHPVKMALVEAQRPAAERPRPAPKAAETVPAAAPKSAARASRVGAAAPAGAALPRGARYSDFFPSSADALRYGAPVGPSADLATGDAKFAALTRNVAPLTRFARELAESVAIPDALTVVASSGEARVRFARRAEKRWSVVLADGDPYFRAALFEALSELSPLSLALDYLEQSGMTDIRITASYRTISPVDMTTPPLTVLVEGRKITLGFARRVASGGWQTLTPIDHYTLGFNFVGAAGLIGDRAAKTYESDVDLKRLRLSPAYARPIR